MQQDSIVVRPYGDINSYTVVGRNDEGLMTVSYIRIDRGGSQFVLEVLDPFTERHQVLGYFSSYAEASVQLVDAVQYAVEQLERSAAHRAYKRAKRDALMLPDGSLPAKDPKKIFGMLVGGIGA